VAFSRQHYKCLKEQGINGEPPRDLIKLSDEELKHLPKYTVLDQALNDGDYSLFDNAVSGLGWVSDLTDPEEEHEELFDPQLLVTPELQEVLDSEISDNPYLEDTLL
ncbi:hypothetical protein MP638_004949, partial [Amoeboaphelidium occidentale]